MVPTKYKIKIKIIENLKVNSGIYKISFIDKYIADNARPGMFVNIKIPLDSSMILRRPFSIYDVNGEKVSVIYSVVGKGTEVLSHINEGDEIDVIGPLGNGFKLERKTAYLIGGGCGTPPLYFLGKVLKSKGIPVYTFLGFSGKNKVILTDEFEKISMNTCYSTDDGSAGEAGNVIQILKNYNIDGVIYACGPKGFLSALKELCIERSIPAQVSLEEVMGCGFGVCLGCAVKDFGGSYKYVCKDGPVFDIFEVELK